MSDLGAVPGRATDSRTLDIPWTPMSYGVVRVPAEPRSAARPCPPRCRRTPAVRIDRRHGHDRRERMIPLAAPADESAFEHWLAREVIGGPVLPSPDVHVVTTSRPVASSRLRGTVALCARPLVTRNVHAAQKPFAAIPQLFPAYTRPVSCQRPDPALRPGRDACPAHKSRWARNGLGAPCQKMSRLSRARVAATNSKDRARCTSRR